MLYHINVIEIIRATANEKSPKLKLRNPPNNLSIQIRKGEKRRKST